MSIGGLIASPTMIIGIVSGLIGFVVYIYWTKFRSDGDEISRVPVFIFNMTKGVERVMAKTFDGLVTYPGGGFVENHDLAVDLRRGRVKKTGQDSIKMKKRTTVYVSRVHSAGALDLSTPLNAPENVSNQRFQTMKDVVAKRAVNEGKMSAVNGDLIGKLLTVAAGITAVLAGAAWLFVVIAPSLV